MRDNLSKIAWIFKMAWRDSRRNRGKLMLFLSSIVIGITALVAINSFSYNMQNAVDNQAKSLLGADILLESDVELTDSLLNYIDSLGYPYSKEWQFASMVYFPGNAQNRGGTRLIQVRALQGDFPYYGSIETIPSPASGEFRNQRAAIVDNSLMLQYGAQPGDSVKLGTMYFQIKGSIHQVPGQSGIRSSAAPPVYIPLQYVDQTGLVQKGSRVEYRIYLKLPDQIDPEKFEDNVRDRFDQRDLDTDTVEERKEDIQETYQNLTGFLNLVAFFALILGCIGVASAVYIYVKEKVGIVAVLRCLGVTGRQAMAIFLVQVVSMGLLGAITGAFLGTMLQWGLPALLGDFLVVDVDLAVSWAAIWGGIVTGFGMALLFALLPLLPLLDISPLGTLRKIKTSVSPRNKYLIYGVIGIIVVFVSLFAYFQLQDWEEALGFVGGLLGALVILSGIALGLMKLLRSYFPLHWPFVFRQGLANLFRPNNQTFVLIMTIGLGVTLITTLYLIQGILIDEVSIKGQGEKRPDMVLFDIQSEQTDSVTHMMDDFQLPVMQNVPIVTTRIESINGRTAREIMEDTTIHRSDWALERDYRVTYRDTLIDSETLTEGKWSKEVNDARDSIYISVAEEIKDNLNVEIGDQITFNVQGALITTRVGSFRSVDFARLQTNFFVVFPTGVLEKAPRFNVIMTKTSSAEKSASFQEAIVQNFPNISIIDLRLILKTVNDILSKVAFVIRFMAIFSILTGLIVLVSSVMLSKYQRMEESVLLRTLGASKKQILSINAVEYMFLGSIAVVSGIILALGASWALTYFEFDTGFNPRIWPLLIILVIISGLTVTIGLLNSRSVLYRPPLEILRKEV